MSSFSWQPLQNSFPYVAKILAWLCPLRAQAARGCVGNSFLDWDKSLMDLLTKRSLKRPSKCLDWRYQVEDWDRDWKILPEWRLDCILGKPKLLGEEGWSGLRGCGGVACSWVQLSCQWRWYAQNVAKQFNPFGHPTVVSSSTMFLV